MSAAESPAGPWYWCLRHHRVEGPGTGCPADERMGPYESAEAAARWQERVEARNEEWEQADREWSGEE